MLYFSAVFFRADNSSLQAVALETLINLFHRQIIQVPVIANIISVPGVVFVGGL